MNLDLLIRIPVVGGETNVRSAGWIAFVFPDSTSVSGLVLSEFSSPSLGALLFFRGVQLPFASLDRAPTPRRPPTSS